MRYQTQDPKYDIEIAGGDPHLVNAATGAPIPLDEPIFIFRAKDKRAVDALMAYRNACDDQDHVRAIEQRVEDFSHFASTHSGVMKEPDTGRATD